MHRVRFCHLCTYTVLDKIHLVTSGVLTGFYGKKFKFSGEA